MGACSFLRDVRVGQFQEIVVDIANVESFGDLPLRCGTCSGFTADPGRAECAPWKAPLRRRDGFLTSTRQVNIIRTYILD